ISNKVEQAGQVDVTQVGTYTLTYGVSDSVGNRAQPITRQVQIVESDESTPGTGGGSGTPQEGASPTPGRMAAVDNPRTSGRIARDKSGVPHNATIEIPAISTGGNQATFHLPPGQSDGGADSDGQSDALISSEGALHRPPPEEARRL